MKNINGNTKTKITASNKMNSQTQKKNNIILSIESQRNINGNTNTEITALKR